MYASPRHAADVVQRERSLFLCLQAINHFWSFSGGVIDGIPFPGKGLYSLVKIVKDESNCCLTWMCRLSCAMQPEEESR